MKLSEFKKQYEQNLRKDFSHCLDYFYHQFKMIDSVTKASELYTSEGFVREDIDCSACPFYDNCSHIEACLCNNPDRVIDD